MIQINQYGWISLEEGKHKLSISHLSLLHHTALWAFGKLRQLTRGYIDRVKEPFQRSQMYVRACRPIVLLTLFLIVRFFSESFWSRGIASLVSRYALTTVMGIRNNERVLKAHIGYSIPLHRPLLRPKATSVMMNAGSPAMSIHQKFAMSIPCKGSKMNIFASIDPV